MRKQGKKREINGRNPRTYTLNREEIEKWKKEKEKEKGANLTDVPRLLRDFPPPAPLYLPGHFLSNRLR